MSPAEWAAEVEAAAVGVREATCALETARADARRELPLLRAQLGSREPE